MQEKLSIDLFIKIKETLQKILEEYEQYYENTGIDEDKYAENYFNIQKTLEKYDLSDIPFELWTGMEIISYENHIPDFSKTKANIDFNIVKCHGAANFSGCNIKNLNKSRALIKEEYFDEKTINENKNLFLSKDIPSSFKNAWYNLNVTPNDLLCLEKGHVSEIEEKSDNTRFSSELQKIIEYIGLTKTYELLKYSQRDFEIVSFFIRKYRKSENDSEVRNALNNCEVTQMKKAVFSLYRSYLLNGKVEIKDCLNFPQEFILENNDIYKINVPLPDDVRTRYYNNSLTLNDLEMYIEYFDDISIDYFLKEAEKLALFEAKFGLGYFQKMFVKHPDVMRYYLYSSNFNEFVNMLEIEPNMDDMLVTATLKWIRYKNLAICKTEGNNIKCLLPEWTASLNINAVYKYTSSSEMFTYNKSTYLYDEEQKNFLDIFGIENIKDLESKNQFFTVDEGISGPLYKVKKIINLIEQLKQAEIFYKNDDQNNKIYYNIFDKMCEHFSPKELLSIFEKYTDILEGNLWKSMDIEYPESDSPQILRDAIDKYVYEKILTGECYNYKELDLPNFKKKYPQLYLRDDAPSDIIKKFNTGTFTIDDFKKNKKLIDIFGSTNVVAALPNKYWWLLFMYKDAPNQRAANENRLFILDNYIKINDAELREVFKKYILRQKENVRLENIEVAAEVFNNLKNSNSSEMRNHRVAIGDQLLQNEDPVKALEKIEDIFLKNNIPTMGKIFACFEILHPNFNDYNFGENSMISPQLKRSRSIKRKRTIVFTDLIKAIMGSNNRSIKEYLNNIEFGFKAYEYIKNGTIDINDFNQTEKEKLTQFRSYLETIYLQTYQGKSQDMKIVEDDNICQDILHFAQKLSPDGSLDYNIADRIIKMFLGFAGIGTFKEAKAYMNNVIKRADQRNRARASKRFNLEEGDMIKGLKDPDFKYFKTILQNGSLSKEFLGASADSDLTPLDTDLSMIIKKEATIEGTIGKTAASAYGPVWIVLKNDSRFSFTRRHTDTTEFVSEPFKLETFYTGIQGTGHYGIRTGFASSEIDYFLMKAYDPKIGLEIAMNGFYIPVIDMNGRIIFTPQMYDDLRSKMSGLAYYGIEEYQISDELSTVETEETKEEIIEDVLRTQARNEKIYSFIKEALLESGIEKVIGGFSKNLMPGNAELYSTGSTSRNTNVPNDSDFDYLVKIDRDIFNSEKKLQILKDKLKKNLNFHDGFNGKICGEIVIEDGTTLDVEISFCPRTDIVELSTDTSLDAKLNAIKEQYPDKYLDVLANIVTAKKMFKSIGAYKSLKSDKNQGGLGGIGIENWILQNGGSLVVAARSFLAAAQKARDFDEFCKIYQVWDLGDNHYIEKNSEYAHDNFVGGKDKMGSEAFAKMQELLTRYIELYEERQMQSSNSSQRM